VSPSKEKRSQFEKSDKREIILSLPTAWRRLLKNVCVCVGGGVYVCVYIHI
jgi:hypothetical protein